MKKNNQPYLPQRNLKMTPKGKPSQLPETNPLRRHLWTQQNPFLPEPLRKASKKKMTASSKMMKPLRIEEKEELLRIIWVIKKP